MESNDLPKIRRFSLLSALILFTLVIAGVKFNTPLDVKPLGIPLIVEKPNLLGFGIAIASVYATLRYIYFGMLLQPSPMRARRELTSEMTLFRVKLHSENWKQTEKEFQALVNANFPQTMRHKVKFEVDMSGRIYNLKIPLAVRLLCRIGDLDFLLPILANCLAVSLWLYAAL